MRSKNFKSEILSQLRLAFIAGLLLLSIPHHLLSQTASPNTVTIPELIRRLESRTFAEREQATQSLVDQGSATLRPLARNLKNASPEIVYRSRKIIQEIAKSGDEATFLRAAGILKLVLFGTLESNFGSMKLLEEDWKRRRTEVAAEKLKQHNAEIKLEKNDWDMAGEGFNPLRMSVVSYPQNPKPEKPERPARLSKNEFQQAIDRVLVGSIDQNRSLVFGDRVVAKELSPNEKLLNQLRAQQIWRDRRAFADDLQFGNIGNSAIVGPDWTGDAAAFAQLAAIENLTDLKIQGIEFTEGYARVLKRLSNLDRLEIRNCSIELEEIKSISQLTSISHFTMTKQPKAAEILQAMSSNENLKGIEIADCNLTSQELKRIAQCKSLAQIFLTGQDVPRQVLSEIGTMERLRYMSMKSCTFDVDAFQALKAKRSSVTFTTVARAFLGVRGPIEFGDAGFECKISEVIPGSGADKAGVIVGDVITQINGHEIKVFNDLILYISQHDIGDGLTLEVVRDGKKKKLSAELGERDPSIQ